MIILIMSISRLIRENWQQVEERQLVRDALTT
jgi:hypothetical protein